MEDDFSNNDLRKEGIDSKSDLDKSKTGKNTSKVVYFILNSMQVNISIPLSREDKEEMLKKETQKQKKKH